MSRETGKCPSFKKSACSRGTNVGSANYYLAEVENIDANRNQRLVEEMRELLPEARKRTVFYDIAHSVAKQIHLSTDEWKMFACALGVKDNYELKEADYFARKDQKEYPLEKLLLEHFNQRQGNLGILIEVLISKELYAVLEEIRPLILDCIQNPPDSSFESPTGNPPSSNHEMIDINIRGDCTLSITCSSNCTSMASSNSCSLSVSGTTVDTESSSSTTSTSSSITDDNCQVGMAKSGNSKTSVYVPKKENSTFQTFCCSTKSNAAPSLFDSNLSECPAATKTIYSFNGPPSTSSNGTSLSSNGSSPDVLSLSEFLSQLYVTKSGDSITESMTSTLPSSYLTESNQPNTVTTINRPLPVYKPIYIFLTHTMADRQLANTVARRLMDDFQIIAVTQSELLQWFLVNHEDTVSTILREMHYVMPVVTPQYLDEIAVPENIQDSSYPELSVRNIFTALQADFFNNSSLNWKVRPVVAEGTNLHLIRKMQELRIAMRLWKDWELVGLMLENTPRYWQERIV